MVDQQHAQLVVQREALQLAHDARVRFVHVFAARARAFDARQRVDDDQRGAGMALDPRAHRLHQPIADAHGAVADIEAVGRRAVVQRCQAFLHAVLAAFQVQVQHVALAGPAVKIRFAVRDRHGQRQCQPAFALLGRARQHGQAHRQRVFQHHHGLLQIGAPQFACGVDGEAVPMNRVSRDIHGQLFVQLQTHEPAGFLRAEFQIQVAGVLAALVNIRTAEAVEGARVAALAQHLRRTGEEGLPAPVVLHMQPDGAVFDVP